MLASRSQEPPSSWTTKLPLSHYAAEREARLKEAPTRQLRVVELSGSPREIGRGHGEEMRHLIREGIERWEEHLESSAGMRARDYLQNLLVHTNFIPAIEKNSPGLLEEVRGIGEGAGVDFDAIYAYQLMDEEWWFRVDTLGADINPAVGCSAVAVRPAGERRTLLAQNMDLPDHYDGTQVVLHLKQDGASTPVEIFVFTPAGLIGTTGMNSNGVGICVNSLRMLGHSPTGLPVAFMMRHALENTSLSDAVEYIRRVPHASGQNYLIADTGGAIDLECSANEVAEYRARGSLLLHTNHPLVNTDVIPRGATSRSRGSNSRKRLELLETSLKKEATVADIKHVLSDRTVPVCVSDRDGQRSITLGSLIMDLGDTPVLHIAPGPSFETDYETLSFS